MDALCFSFCNRYLQHGKPLYLKFIQREHPVAFLAAGLFFAAAEAVPPSTESFSALAGVKRSRVRANILICSPVAGLRPIRAASLRLRKMPSPFSGL
jgi:hypothetical protein